MRVVIFMRIRHNVFTSLDAGCTVRPRTVQYAGAADALNVHVCHSCYGGCSTRVVLSLCATHTPPLETKTTVRSFSVNIGKMIMPPHRGTLSLACRHTGEIVNSDVTQC